MAGAGMEGWRWAEPRIWNQPTVRTVCVRPLIAPPGRGGSTEHLLSPPSCGAGAASHPLRSPMLQGEMKGPPLRSGEGTCSSKLASCQHRSTAPWSRAGWPRDMRQQLARSSQASATSSPHPNTPARCLRGWAQPSSSADVPICSQHL